MRPILQRAVITIFGAATFFAFSSSRAGEGNGTNSPTAKDDPIAIVHKYVAAHQGWKTSDYTVKEDHKEEGFTVYLVFYLPDKKMGYPGGGESFLAYYDPVTRSVVKEMHFQ